MALDDLVWYAAYGSNLAYERFMAYLRGGPVEGRLSVQKGASDPSPPLADRPYRLNHELYFAEDAPAWHGGGVAFVRSEAHPEALTLARIFLITAGQFLELVAQENGTTPEAIATRMTRSTLVGGQLGERVELAGGWYDLALCLGTEPLSPGEAKRYPVWTFTSSRDRSESAQFPSPQYLGTIGRGLLETYWGVDRDDATLDLHQLEAYLQRTTPPCDQSQAQVAAALGCCPGLSQAMTVMPTEDRRGAGRVSIVQLHPDDHRALGLPRRRSWLRRRPLSVILESYHRHQRVRVRAVVHQPPVSRGKSAAPEAGRVKMDQKLRQALGIQPGDRVLVRRPTGAELRPREELTPLARAFHWCLQHTCGVQRQIMRVTKARFADMEIPICRIPASGFDVLGLEPGDRVVLESVTGILRRRAIEATDEILRERRETSSAFWDCHRELSLHRTASGNPKSDLPLIFIDFDARSALGVKPCDPVYVYRDIAGLLWKQLRLLGITLVLSGAIVIVQLESLTLWQKVTVFAGTLLVGLLLVLFEIRKRIT